MRLEEEEEEFDSRDDLAIVDSKVVVAFVNGNECLSQSRPLDAFFLPILLQETRLQEFLNCPAAHCGQNCKSAQMTSNSRAASTSEDSHVSSPLAISRASKALECRVLKMSSMKVRLTMNGLSQL